MRLAVLALALPLASGAAPAPKPTLPPTPPDVAAKMSLLFAKASPAVRSWVDAEARKLRPMPRIDLAMVATDARMRFASAAAPLTPAQADLLAAMALYQTAKDLESEFVMRGLHDKKDTINELNEQDILVLRQMMEKKQQLEAMISSVMKASYEGGQAAISALKAS
jgi:hypothetical protein